jgi:hypothetical protein
LWAVLFRRIKCQALCGSVLPKLSSSEHNISLNSDGRKNNNLIEVWNSSYIETILSNHFVLSGTSFRLNHISIVRFASMGQLRGNFVI